jgi:phosphoserine phosphatase
MATKLDGLGSDVLDSITRTIKPIDGTIELVQTLKVLGYRIALLSRGFSFFTDAARELTGIDHAFGVPLGIDADSRTVVGQLPSDAALSVDQKLVTTALAAREGVAVSDVTLMTDHGLTEPIGLRFDFDMATILSHYKRHILSKDALIGLVGAFGWPNSAAK